LTTHSIRILSEKLMSAIQILNYTLVQKNLFYCEALNKEIKMSKGNFTLCLNDDVVLDKGFITEAIRGFLLDPKIGMVSGKILRSDGKTIDSTGLFLSLWRTTKESLSYAH